MVVSRGCMHSMARDKCSGVVSRKDTVLCECQAGGYVLLQHDQQGPAYRPASIIMIMSFLDRTTVVHVLLSRGTGVAAELVL